MSESEMSDYEKQMSVVTSIRGGIKKYNDLLKNSACDKIGFGVNLDGRFSAAEINFRIDSWAGFYGDSGCSEILSFHEKEIFVKNFIRVIGNNLNRLLLETATLIERESNDARLKLIAEFEDKLEFLKSIAPEKE